MFEGRMIVVRIECSHPARRLNHRLNLDQNSYMYTQTLMATRTVLADCSCWAERFGGFWIEYEGNENCLCVDYRCSQVGVR